MEDNQATSTANLQPKRRINLRSLNKILMLLLAVSFVYYLTSTNDLAVKSFKLKDLKTHMSDLQQENIDLEVQSASLASYQVLQEKIATLDLTATNNVQYIDATASMMAKK